MRSVNYLSEILYNSLPCPRFKSIVIGVYKIRRYLEVGIEKRRLVSDPLSKDPVDMAVSHRDLLALVYSLSNATGVSKLDSCVLLASIVDYAMNHSLMIKHSLVEYLETCCKDFVLKAEGISLELIPSGVVQNGMGSNLDPSGDFLEEVMDSELQSISASDKSQNTKEKSMGNSTRVDFNATRNLKLLKTATILARRYEALTIGDEYMNQKKFAPMHSFVTTHVRRILKEIANPRVYLAAFKDAQKLGFNLTSESIYNVYRKGQNFPKDSEVWVNTYRAIHAIKSPAPNGVV